MIFNQTEKQEKEYLQQVITTIHDTINTTSTSVKEHIDTLQEYKDVYKRQDLMIITDHINYFPEHPLRGKNIPYGPRFPDMSEAYCKELISKADEIAKEKGIKVQHGVYIGTQGPTCLLYTSRCV